MLEELDELRQENNELATTVANLVSDLEKERSKNNPTHKVQNLKRERDKHVNKYWRADT